MVTTEARGCSRRKTRWTRKKQLLWDTWGGQQKSGKKGRSGDASTTMMVEDQTSSGGSQLLRGLNRPMNSKRKEGTVNGRSKKDRALLTIVPRAKLGRKTPKKKNKKTRTQSRVGQLYSKGDSDSQTTGDSTHPHPCTKKEGS